MKENDSYESGGFCEDVVKEFGLKDVQCCGSCHSDDERTVELDLGDGRMAFVCCTVSEAAKAKLTELRRPLT